METTALVGLSLLGMTVAATLANGGPFRTDINPVLLYSQAFLVAPDLSQADHDYLFTNDWQGQKLPDRFGELVSRYDNEFKFVRQAAQAKVPAEWGIDWSPGPFTLLPHLARIKAVAQVSRLRAMWDLQHNRQSDACDDLVAALVMARNGSRDSCLISALVQAAAEGIVCRTVAENFNQLSPETLKRLADGFDAAPARGTMAASIGIEKTCHDWMLNKVLDAQKNYPGDDAKAVGSIASVFDTSFDAGAPGDTNIWAEIVAAAGGTGDGLVKLLRGTEPLYPRLAEILSLPVQQYDEQMKAFSDEIRNSTNPVVRVLFPAYEKCKPKEFAILADLAMVRAAIEYKLHGEAGLSSVADPCGNGPFAYERFSFEGVDRGFELKSAYSGRGFPEVMIFVEKDGTPFEVTGKNAGEAPRDASARK